MNNEQNEKRKSLFSCEKHRILHCQVVNYRGQERACPQIKNSARFPPKHRGNFNGAKGADPSMLKIVAYFGASAPKSGIDLTFQCALILLPKFCNVSL